ncbi:DNA methyltransferase [Rhodopseudomonas sp. AAP120]|uniref:DNA methyltransferase n=1 Tax=Rhodopseudomonas sp. AAP120 TaxID=1523430 RepID=UPI0024C0D18C|nr:DNA methyltransferase [Rhodopseudomonas sp. AAP120]
MSLSRVGAKAVDAPVLLGTPTPVPLGTRVPYYWERAHAVTLWRDKTESAPSNFPNSESFGLLLTRLVGSRICGHSRCRHSRRAARVLPTAGIRTNCPQGGLVSDWFAGSGAAGEACRLAGRRYLGCEIDAGMAELARVRIASVLPFAEGAQP